MTRALFICEGNLHRSPTAERLYSTTPGVQARSAGLSRFARTQVTDELLDWAEIIFVMEARLHRLLRRQFRNEVANKRMVCLDIPDEYQRDQPELLAVLIERLTVHIGAPEVPLRAS